MVQSAEQHRPAFRGRTQDGIDRERACGIHTLRHCFASHLMEDGVALPVIQQLLGHTSLKTTSVYCHVSRALLGSVRSPADVPDTGDAAARAAR